MNKNKQTGFTIVELLVVIVVIGILAAIVTVGFNGVQRSAAQAVLKSDASQLATTLAVYEAENNGQFPEDDDDLQVSEGTTLEYTATSSAYCATLSSAQAQASFYIDSVSGDVTSGVCPDSDHVGYDPNAGTPLPLGLWTDLSVGYSYVCGIYDDAPYCWGLAQNGVLGYGGSSGTRTVPNPVNVSSGPLSGKTVTQIAASSQFAHTCATADGEAFCWGSNNYGQVGDGTTSGRNSPTAVSTAGVLSGKTVTQIAVNGSHTCAIADGDMFCWGYNQHGKLGTGSTSPTSSSVPVAVTTSGVLSGKTITKMALGSHNTCVIADGEAFCWGQGSYGVLGRGSTGSSASPVAVSTSGVLNGKTVTDISVADYHVCAVADGEVFCWGMGSRINNGYSANETLPVAIQTNGALGGATVTQVFASYDHSCIVAGGDAYCWGSGGSGRLGNGSSSDELYPFPVINTGAIQERQVSKISAGHSHSCVLARGEVFCWGVGTSGQIGDGLSTSTNEPVQVVNPS